MKRITLLTSIGGGALFLLGLLVLGGTVAPELRNSGLLAMSFGGMAIAIPLYFEARKLHSERLEAAVRRGKVLASSRCVTCGKETAMFWCTTHTVRLCPDCVPQHDEPSRCLYRSLLHNTPNSKA